MTLLERVQSWFRKKQVDGSLEDELRFHLEKEVALNVARGMSADEARRRALISFGGVQQTRETVHEVRWTHFIEVLTQDLRYAGRMLRKSPGFTFACIAMLAFGIGMNTAIFSLIDAVLFRPLPAKHPEELVLLHWRAHHRPKAHGETNDGDCPDDPNPRGCAFSLPFLNRIQSPSGVFSGVAAFAGLPRLDVSDNRATTISYYGKVVSGDFFSTLGIRASTGRVLVRADDTPASTPVLVLGHAYWKRTFAADPNVVGRTIRLNTVPFTIVGVVEPGFGGLSPGSDVDLWLPLAARAHLYPTMPPSENGSASWWLVIVGRNKPGVSVEQTQAALTLLYRDETLHNGKPLFDAADNPEIEIVPAQAGLEGSRPMTLKPLYILMAAVGLVLLIACANIAGLLLARAVAREKEMAVRLVLGAKRGRLVLQLLTESVLLSSAGGALGCFVAISGTRAIRALSTPGPSVPGAFAPHVDARVMIFTALASILTGILFGMAPALRSLRPALAPALKTGNALDHRKSWHSPGNTLVVAQIALAVVALVGSGLLLHSLANLKKAELGFDSRNLLIFGIDPPATRYSGAKMDELFRGLQQEFAALPGVSAVTYSWMPLLGSWSWNKDFHLPDTPGKTEGKFHFLPVGSGFFETMRVPFKAGRDFTAAEFVAAAAKPSTEAKATAPSATAPEPLIVNEAFVRRYLGGMNPIGQLVRAGPPGAPAKTSQQSWTIVGVVSDARYSNLREEIGPTVYAISTDNAFFSIRTAGDPELLVATLRAAVNRRDPEIALYGLTSESEQVEGLLFQERYLGRFSGFFALLALLLASTGIYGLLSFEVARRTREIGIRLALGAQRTDAIRLVLSHGLLLVLVGAGVGIGLSFTVVNLFATMIYKVGSADPLTLASVPMLLALVALAACYIPARRATRVDPLVALRYE